ncbi:MAG: FmdB family zinc ribbon protein [Dehalococcoidia bacterium]
MPLYDYRCAECLRVTTIFTKSVFQEVEPVCAYCGGKEMRRLVSPFAYHKSIQTIHEESGPPPKFPTMDYYKDPRNIGRYVEEKFKEFGMELPKGVKEQIEAARQGEVPKELGL